MDEYLTVATKATGEYSELHSRFITNIIPVSSETEAVAFIDALRQKYWDAKHNVYAYILREGGICRYSDDGEPHGTAGVPTLEMLKKQGLCDVCAVTTRYFGGILLGTGGLVRAYTASARAALDNAGIVRIRECDCCVAECSYAGYSALDSALKSSGAFIEGSDFSDKVTVKFCLASENIPRLQKNLDDIFSGTVKLKKSGKMFMPFKESTK